jgi:hypothetical protein
LGVGIWLLAFSFWPLNLKTIRADPCRLVYFSGQKKYPSRLVLFSGLSRTAFVHVPVYHYGVPAEPSGFPLYLFSLRSQRMPLQSLTREGLQILLGGPYIN